jgi:hypothetical protein
VNVGSNSNRHVYHLTNCADKGQLAYTVVIVTVCVSGRGMIAISQRCSLIDSHYRLEKKVGAMMSTSTVEGSKR